MGRWAQRTRRGGGGPSAPPLGTVASANYNGPLDAQFEFSKDVVATDFDPSAFFDTSAGADGIAVSQVDPVTINITFDNVINIGDNWLYTGHVAGIVTPQSGTIDA